MSQRITWNAIMATQREPEILPPTARFGAGDRIFRDENLDLLSRVLDSWFRIPGTSIRFGLDGIIGLVPGIGDILAGLASCIIILAAWARGAPYVTIARMLVNLALDVIIGTVPLFGDLFDIAWKANRRNYALLTRHLEQPRRRHLERLALSGRCGARGRRNFRRSSPVCRVAAARAVHCARLAAWITSRHGN